MTPKVPTSDSGTATLGMAVAQRLRRKDEHDQDHQDHGDHHGHLNVVTEARMVVVRSCVTWMWIDGGIEACSIGRIFADAVHRVDDVGRAAGGIAQAMTECLPFTDPALRLFCWASTTVATSDKRTGAPLW